MQCAIASRKGHVAAAETSKSDQNAEVDAEIIAQFDHECLLVPLSVSKNITLRFVRWKLRAKRGNQVRVTAEAQHS